MEHIYLIRTESGTVKLKLAQKTMDFFDIFIYRGCELNEKTIGQIACDYQVMTAIREQGFSYRLDKEIYNCWHKIWVQNLEHCIFNACEQRKAL